MYTHLVKGYAQNTKIMYSIGSNLINLWLVSAQETQFSMRALILVHPNCLSQSYLLVFLHWNSLQHSLVFESCHGSSIFETFPTVVA